MRYRQDNILSLLYIHSSPATASEHDHLPILIHSLCYLNTAPTTNFRICCVSCGDIEFCVCGNFVVEFATGIECESWYIRRFVDVWCAQVERDSEGRHCDSTV